MQPPPPESQSVPNSNSASRTTESTPRSSRDAFRCNTMDNKGLSLDTLHMHVAEQDYRIKCLWNINREIEKNINQFRDQLRTDDSMDPALEDLLEKHLQRRQEKAAEIEHSKKLNDDLRGLLEKILSTMSEAEKSKERSEFDLADLLKSLRQRLVSLESDLVYNKNMFEVFRHKLILILIMEKQSIARQRSSKT